MSQATLRFVSLVLFGVSVVLVSISPASASTEILVNDTFTATVPPSVPIATHAPDVNLPGQDPNLAAGTYFAIGVVDLGIGGSTGTPSPGGIGLGAGGYPINTPNIARVGNDSGLAISLASNGGYTKPTTFTISADMNLEGMEAHASGGADIQTVGAQGVIGGIALGFYPDTTTLSGQDRNILGVAYSDSGKLLLIKPSGFTDNSQVVAVVSTYDPSNDPIPLTGTHRLSYTVNNLTGGLSNVTFDGFAINFGVTTLFTNTATTYAGWYSRSGSNNDFGLLDNFEVTTETPEPASLGLLAMGSVMLLRRRARVIIKPALAVPVLCRAGIEGRPGPTVPA